LISSRQCYSGFVKYGSDPHQYGFAATEGSGDVFEENVGRVLADLQGMAKEDRITQTATRNHKCQDDEHFFAVQVEREKVSPFLLLTDD
jgi:hypothetical protein